MLIGCGKMGSIIYKHIAEQTLVIERDTVLHEVKAIPNIIILAIKPQDFTPLAHDLKRYINKDTVAVSIIAGITEAEICSSLGTKNIIRAMPNTPARISMGATTLYSNYKNKKEIAQGIFSSLGKVFWVENEEMLTAATAISGSGPAYLFYFLQAWRQAALELGLDSALAEQLILQTVSGALHLSENQDLSKLITEVASKGGTTEKALLHFEKHNLSQTIVSAIHAAHQRAKELSRS